MKLLMAAFIALMVGAICVALSINRSTSKIPKSPEPTTQTLAEREAERKRDHEAYMKALEAPVPHRTYGSNYAAGSDADKVRRGCTMAHSLYDNKPMSDLTRNQLKMVQACEALGL